MPGARGRLPTTPSPPRGSPLGCLNPAIDSFPSSPLPPSPSPVCSLGRPVAQRVFDPTPLEVTDVVFLEWLIGFGCWIPSQAVDQNHR